MRSSWTTSSPLPSSAQPQSSSASQNSSCTPWRSCLLARVLSAPPCGSLCCGTSSSGRSMRGCCVCSRWWWLTALCARSSHHLVSYIHPSVHPSIHPSIHPRRENLMDNAEEISIQFGSNWVNVPLVPIHQFHASRSCLITIQDLSLYIDQLPLTYLGLVMHDCTKQVTSHYLNQCCKMPIWSWGTNSNEIWINTLIFFAENIFENVVCKMVSILFRPQCAKLLFLIFSTRVGVSAHEAHGGSL